MEKWMGWWFTAALLLVTASAGARADYAVPGCEDAWNAIDRVKGLDDLWALVTTDCAVLYRKGWRLPINDNKGGIEAPEVCEPAWRRLDRAGVLDRVEFMVTHNCPVFYRHGWIKPPR